MMTPDWSKFLRQGDEVHVVGKHHKNRALHSPKYYLVQVYPAP